MKDAWISNDFQYYLLNQVGSRINYWERASSIASDGIGNFIITVDIYSAYYNYDGVYKVTSGGIISQIAVGDPFTDPTGVVIDSNGNYIVVDEGSGPARTIQVTPEG